MPLRVGMLAVVVVLGMGEVVLLRVYLEVHQRVEELVDWRERVGEAVAASFDELLHRALEIIPATPRRGFTRARSNLDVLTLS